MARFKGYELLIKLDGKVLACCHVSFDDYMKEATPKWILEADLKDALEREDYERCAEIRDELDDLSI